MISSGILSVSRVRKLRSTGHEETPCPRRFLEPLLCEGCTLASKTVRSVPCPSGRGPGRRK